MWARGRARSWFFFGKNGKTNEKIVNKKAASKEYSPRRLQNFIHLYRNVTINRAPIKPKHSEKKRKNVRTIENIKTSKKINNELVDSKFNFRRRWKRHEASRLGRVLASPGRTRFGGMNRRFDCGPNTLHRYWFVVQQTRFDVHYTLVRVPTNWNLWISTWSYSNNFTNGCRVRPTCAHCRSKYFSRVQRVLAPGRTRFGGMNRQKECGPYTLHWYWFVVQQTRFDVHIFVVGYARFRRFVSKHCVNSKTGRRQWQWHTRVRSSNRCEGMARMLWWRLRKKNKLSDTGALLD